MVCQLFDISSSLCTTDVISEVRSTQMRDSKHRLVKYQDVQRADKTTLREEAV